MFGNFNLEAFVTQNIGGVPFLAIVGFLLLAFGTFELVTKNAIPIIFILSGIGLLMISGFSGFKL